MLYVERDGLLKLIIRKLIGSAGREVK